MPLAANELPHPQDPLFLLTCPVCMGAVSIAKIGDFETVWLARANPEPRRIRVILCPHAKATGGLGVSFY